LKRPWLLTPRGQRVAILVATLLSILAIIPAANQIAQEVSRDVPQLDSTNVFYCELPSCGEVDSVPGLVVQGSYVATESEFGVFISIPVLNTALLSGEREVWVQLKSAAGAQVEGMRGRLVLGTKGQNQIEVFFTGNLDELDAGTLHLGF